MATAEAEAHIKAQEQLRLILMAAVAATWTRLPNHDEVSVAPFVAVTVPLVLAAQRQSAALTNAFLGRSLRRPPLPIDINAVIGAQVRNGTPPELVYRRPFVTTWSALAEHRPFSDALAAGLHRATSAAAMDVQNTMRHTLRLVGEADPLILGYRRVPDADACEFCKLIAGRRYLTSDLQPVHNHCGCGVDVITEANRGDFTGKRENDLQPEGVAVRDHGELGPLLVSPTDHFTGLDELAA